MYELIEICDIDKHIKLMRVKSTDIKLTLRSVVASLSNLSWISNFDKDYMKQGFSKRADITIEYITKNIITNDASGVTSSSGEYVVSELARTAVIDHLKYLDVPLAELFKIKAVGNHGFDFYSKNTNKIILFGEAKYLSAQSAYGNCFEQIVKFIEEDLQDTVDIVDIECFFCEESLSYFSNGKKGFIAAFSNKNNLTESLLKYFHKNENYLKLTKFEELICVAVEL